MSRRLILFGEGHTEKVLPEFLGRALNARLDTPVGITFVRFEGWTQLVDDAKKKAAIYLNGKKSGEIIAVVGLLDLYGPTLYPGQLTTVREKYDWLKARMESKVDDPRFVQHFAVHEIEAWLLSDLNALPTDVRKALEKKATRPETINFDTPPAKLLQATYSGALKRDYAKVTEARNRFPKLAPDTVAAKCPFFREMLDDLENRVRIARGIDTEAAP